MKSVGPLSAPGKVCGSCEFDVSGFGTSTKLVGEECYFFLLRGRRGFRPLRNGLGAVAPLGG